MSTRKTQLHFTFCHRKPGRSFFWRGKQFPVCARCTGIHIGYLSFPLFTFNFWYLDLWITLLLILPTVIDNVQPGDTIEQEEIFAPVLAVIKAKDYDHALEIANGTEFGLTGAVYSKSEERLEQARRDFHVGNLYLNRKCTGALVGVHPFGGFNMSGTDSKAGGREYLLQFMQGKSIARKV